MTVVRRYGVSNGLKVPLGSFFGQTLPSPWQLMYHGHFYQQIYHKSLLHYEKIKQNPETSTVKDDDNDESLITPVYKQKCQLQLEFYKSLLEDIQCRCVCCGVHYRDVWLEVVLVHAFSIYIV